MTNITRNKDKENPLDVEFSKCEKGHHPTYLKHPPSGLLVRNRGDVGVIIDQYVCYKYLLRIRRFSAATLLDLGANVGASAWWFMINGLADRVVSVEPDPECADIFRANHGTDPRIDIIEAAAVGDEDPSEMDLYLGITYAGCNSLEPYRGRSTVRVRTVRFTDLVDTHHPTIIKCDVEGSEFRYRWSGLPTCVRIVCAEMHQNKESWIELGRRMDEDLLSSGFRHLRKPKHEPMFIKTQIAVWKR